MAVKEGMQKVISVRFNLAREDERRLYDDVISHGRNIAGDIYGSSGAYIKAALNSFCADREQADREHLLKEQMKEYIEMVAKRQAEEFMDKLGEHDEKLAGQIISVVQMLIGGTDGSGAIRYVAGNSNETAEPDMKDPSGFIAWSGDRINENQYCQTTKEPRKKAKVNRLEEEQKNRTTQNEDKAIEKEDIQSEEGTVVAVLDEEPVTELPVGAMDFLDVFC